jgi:hypothetical protein
MLNLPKPGAKPPPAFVRGKITRIDPKNPDLVEINLGSDHGIKKDHTLEVFRLEPAKYLGQLRVLAVKANNAVGRLVRSKSSVQVGDEVASSLDKKSAIPGCEELPGNQPILLFPFVNQIARIVP